MHDIRWIRDNPEAFDAALKLRGLSGEATRLIALDETRRTLILKLETAQARRNSASKEIGEAKKKKDEATAQKLMAEVAALKDDLPKLDAEEKAASKALEDALAWIPNLPLEDVPNGADEHGNVEKHHFGAKRNYAFTPKQHFELGEALGFMDFEAAAKLSGARFVVLKKGLARLERALGQFMLDVHTSEPHNYTEVAPPLMVRDEVMFGTAQLPKFESDQYLATFKSEMDQAKLNTLSALVDKLRKLKATKQDLESDFDGGIPVPIRNDTIRAIAAINVTIQRTEREIRAVQDPDHLWLIPTAEVPLTNLVRESILDEAELPLRMTALTPCFRAEAGAAGRDTRGMIRQHQFSKCELVSITTPEQSSDEHERMLACAEEVLRRLRLHYRVMTLCTGDMGFASQKTYDIEVWLPGQNAYREISSCSVCGDFQARRMDARYRSKETGKPRHVHTLNGSGVAVGRAMVAVMETYQEADGSISVPEVLQPYMGGMKKIQK